MPGQIDREDTWHSLHGFSHRTRIWEFSSYFQGSRNVVEMGKSFRYNTNHILWNQASYLGNFRQPTLDLGTHGRFKDLQMPALPT